MSAKYSLESEVRAPSPSECITLQLSSRSCSSDEQDENIYSCLDSNESQGYKYQINNSRIASRLYRSRCILLPHKAPDACSFFVQENIHGDAVDQRVPEELQADHPLVHVGHLGAEEDVGD